MHLRSPSHLMPTMACLASPSPSPSPSHSYYYSYSIHRYLPEILRLALPGIDANDTAKTWAALGLFEVIFTWLPIHRSYRVPYRGPCEPEHKQYVPLYAEESPPHPKQPSATAATEAGPAAGAGVAAVSSPSSEGGALLEEFAPSSALSLCCTSTILWSRSRNDTNSSSDESMKCIEEAEAAEHLRALHDYIDGEWGAALLERVWALIEAQETGPSQEQQQQIPLPGTKPNYSPQSGPLSSCMDAFFCALGDDLEVDGASGGVGDDLEVDGASGGVGAERTSPHISRTAHSRLSADDSSSSTAGARRRLRRRLQEQTCSYLATTTPKGRAAVKMACKVMECMVSGDPATLVDLVLPQLLLNANQTSVRDGTCSAEKLAYRLRMLGAASMRAERGNLFTLAAQERDAEASITYSTSSCNSAVVPPRPQASTGRNCNSTARVSTDTDAGPASRALRLLSSMVTSPTFFQHEDLSVRIAVGKLVKNLLRGALGFYPCRVLTVPIPLVNSLPRPSERDISATVRTVAMPLGAPCLDMQSYVSVVLIRLLDTKSIMNALKYFQSLLEAINFNACYFV